MRGFFHFVFSNWIIYDIINKYITTIKNTKERGLEMNRLKELRLEKHKSQVALAMDLNTTQASISKYETGDAMLDIPTLIQLAAYFSVTMEYLLGVSDQKTAPADLSELDNSFLNLYHCLTPSQKKKALSFMHELKK